MDETLQQVLLVDDNSANLQVLYHTLNGRGYRLLIANGGLQALEIAEKVRPALILLDIMMPGIDGFETCRRLKRNAATSASAVIFLSALDDAGNKVKGFQLGAIDYIAKPFDSDEVIVRVETHLKIHRLEAQLADRNRQLEADNRRILAAMNEGIIGLDASGRISFVNPAALRMSGGAESALLGAPLAVCGAFRDGGQQSPDATFDECWTLGATRHSDDSLFVRPDGTVFPVEYTCSPVFEGRTLAGAVIVFRDIEERKKAQLQLKQAYAALEKAHAELQEAQMRLIQAAKLESVGRLAAGVAHEVKNPLAVMQLGLDYLTTAQPNDGSVSEVIADMEDAVARADSVIKGLLDFSRESELALAPGDINRVIEQALHLVEHEMTQHDIRLEQALDERIPSIRLDGGKLQQVFINLFMNAIQAMGRRGVLTVRTRLMQVDDHGAADLDPDRFSAGERVVEVEVLDTGCGIADESMVFDPFYTTKPVGQGTGLGLSVTRKIIDLHKGAITLRNRAEGGAAVRMTLKVAGE